MDIKASFLGDIRKIIPNYFYMFPLSKTPSKLSQYIDINDDKRNMAWNSGARFTKHFKPKIFVSPIQTVWDLRKS